MPGKRKTTPKRASKPKPKRASTPKRQSAVSEAQKILNKFSGLGLSDTYDEICSFLLKKHGLNMDKIKKFVDSQQ